MARFCTNCGSKIGDNDKFCPSCGSQLPSGSINQTLPFSDNDRQNNVSRVVNTSRPGGYTTVDQKPARHTNSDRQPARNTSIDQQPARNTSIDQQPARNTNSDQKPARHTKSDRQPVRHINTGGHTSSERKSGGYEYDNGQRSQEQSSGKKRGLSLFLALVMVVELAVIAFVTPGYLKDRGNGGKGEDQGLISSLNKGDGYSDGDNGGDIKGEGGDEELDPGFEFVKYEDPLVTLPTADGINVFYTEEQVKDAPSHEADISKEELYAVCGDVSAEFNSWDIVGDDKLIVRDLPDLTDEDAGCMIHAYDFSLSSGKDEFATGIELTIPRRARGSEESYCVTIDDKTGRWKRVYSEISEDGSYYLIHTDHFSPKGEVVMTPEKNEEFKKMLAEISQDRSLSTEDLKGSDINKTMGAFYYPGPVRWDQRMTAPVACDYRLLWTIYQDAYNLNAMAEIIDPQNPLAFQSPMQIIYGVIGDYNNTVGTADSIRSALEGPGQKAVTEAKKIADAVAPAKKIPTLSSFAKGFHSGINGIGNIIGSYLTYSQVANEVGQGKTVIDSANENKLELVSSVLSIGGMVITSGPVSWGLTVGGLCVYGISLYYSGDEPRTLSVAEQAYRDYYATDDTSRRFHYGGTLKENSRKNGVDVIPVLKSLTDEENKRLSDKINKELGGLGGIAPPGGKAKMEIQPEWAETFRFIYDLCEQKPEQLANVMIEFLTNYAKCNSTECMDAQTYLEFNKLYLEQRNRDVTLAAVPSDKEQAVMISNMVQDMMAMHLDVLYGLMSNAKFKCQSEMEETIKSNLLPRLNTMVEFHVYDYSCEDLQSLEDSIYNVKYDWKSGVEGYGEDHRRADAPMRFAFEDEKPVDMPAFIPRIDLTESGNISREIYPANVKDYYPFRDNFFPQVNEEEGNCVFRCTYYHYLLMGAPTKMIFHDMDEKVPDEAVDFEVDEPDSDGVIRVRIDVEPSAVKEEEAVEEEKKPAPAEALYGTFYGEEVDNTGLSFNEALTGALDMEPVVVEADGSFSGSRTYTSDVEPKSIPVDDITISTNFKEGGFAVLIGSGTQTETQSTTLTINFRGKIDLSTGKGEWTYDGVAHLSEDAVSDVSAGNGIGAVYEKKDNWDVIFDGTGGVELSGDRLNIYSSSEQRIDGVQSKMYDTTWPAEEDRTPTDTYGYEENPYSLTKDLFIDHRYTRR
ncbi:MAG: zinc ribbon domain-containing protein [Lachnospiraceae bacterium]|nr:zinc ribbon domain-containing protein [Lachnospiraceae bacterium]